MAHYRTFFIALVTSALILNGKEAISQGEKDNAQHINYVPDSASPPAGQPEKLSATMYVSYNVSDSFRLVNVRLTRKENRKNIPVDNLASPVKIYFNEVKEYNPADGTGWIGSIIPGNDGKGTIKLPENQIKLISNRHTYTFIAKIDSDPVYEDIEEAITVSDANIIIEYSGEDSIKKASAVLYGWNDSAFIPMPGTELKLCIKRTFSLFPVAEGLVTDENGMVSSKLPLDIPGSMEGTITLVAKIEDHETFGTVEVTKIVPWAVLPKVQHETGRTLWSSGGNAPLPLVIASVAIIIIIWGTIFYLVYLLIKIRKISREQSFRSNERSH